MDLKWTGDRWPSQHIVKEFLTGMSRAARFEVKTYCGLRGITDVHDRRQTGRTCESCFGSVAGIIDLAAAPV